MKLSMLFFNSQLCTVCILCLKVGYTLWSFNYNLAKMWLAAK